MSFYTLGQRKGIGVGGQRDGSGRPWFVARKDLARNTLWIVQGHEHPWLRCEALRCVDASWIAGVPPPALRGAGRWSAKTRYRQQDAPCRLQCGLRGGHADTFGLVFDEPQWAATPGQSAVLYDGELCLGGGVIASVDGESSAVVDGALDAAQDGVRTATDVTADATAGTAAASP